MINYLNYVSNMSFKMAKLLGFEEVTDFNEYIEEWHMEEVVSSSGDMDSELINYYFLTYLVEELGLSDVPTTSMKEHNTGD